MDWKPRIAVYLPGDVRHNVFGPIVDTFAFDGSTYVAYGALAGVVLCDRQLHYIETLRIQDAFPSRSQDFNGWPVHGLRCVSDQTGIKILAWSGRHAVLWQKKTEKKRNDVWSIWSSMTLEREIVFMDYRENHLVISLDSGVRVSKSAHDLDVPAWETLVSFPTKQASKCCLSPSATFMAWYNTDANEVYVVAIPRGTSGEKAPLPQSLRHRRLITDIFWRDNRSQDDFYLYTTAVDGAFRLFTVMEDDPSWFQLAASGSTTDIAQPCQPFVAFGVDEAIFVSADNSHHFKNREEEAAGHDHVFWLDRRGKLSRSILKGLSRRPPRAISVKKISASGAPPLLTHFDHRSKAFCCSAGLGDIDLDIVAAVSTGDSTYNLVSNRVDMRNSEIRRGEAPTSAETPNRAMSVFRHLPLDRLHSDRGSALFEDDEHFHTISHEPSRDTTWRITSTPKPSGKNVHCIYIALEQTSGVLTLTPEVIKFQPNGRQARKSPSTSCPPALSRLLESGAGVEHVLASVTANVATLYLFQLSIEGAFLLWRIQIPTQRGSLFLQQLLKRDGDNHPTIKTILPPGGRQLLKKTVLQQGDCDELRLAYACDEEVKQIQLSMDAETFKLRDLDSTPIIPEGLKYVTTDGTRKIATVNDGILRIWDTVSSKFGSGLEYTSDPNETITACAYAVEELHTLALACGDRVSILCLATQGMETQWVPLLSSRLPLFSATPITSLAWLPGSHLLVSNGAQALVLSRDIGWKGYSSNISDVVQAAHAPLPDAHPENLVQCVLWDKFHLVKGQLRRISAALKEDAAAQVVDLASIDVRRYMGPPKSVAEENAESGLDRYRNKLKGKSSEWQSLLSSLTTSHTVLRRLTRSGLYKLSLQDLQTLGSLAKTIGYAEEQAQALDPNGRRYLMSFSARTEGDREMSHEEATWALHSQSTIVCFQTVISQCTNELVLWGDVRRYKLSYWLEDAQITELAETLARNHFVTENRNPIPTSIYYFALRKPKTVWGLWRQVAGHPERAAMLKFLQNNFEDPRWQSAALKNAYALLGRQRFQYAAAFFLLGECPKDAIRICIKHLQDYDLAVFIARTRQDREILLPWVIETYILPRAAELNDKWLVHWCWWVQGKREPAIREIYARSTAQGINERHHDDATTMAVLLQDFKTRPETKSICARTVPIEREMEIVRYCSNRLRSIGCEALALSVLAKWHFDSPARAKVRDNVNGFVLGDDEASRSLQYTTHRYEHRPIPKERSDAASVMAQGPVQDSAQTQGAVEFDMGAFF